MSKLIPEHIDPFRYAEQSLSIDGEARLVEMQRLNTLLHDKNDSVAVDLKFGIDEQGITYVKGHLKTTVKLQCQRCLEPFSYEIMSDFALGVVNNLDEANSLPEHYEPALTKDGLLGLRDLIEDELILNLPIIPRHEADQCKVKLPLIGAGDDHIDNPFKVLANLKGKGKITGQE